MPLTSRIGWLIQHKGLGQTSRSFYEKENLYSIGSCGKY
jgi:hypothetical protein